MIYWGLNILSPGIFFVATLLICSIVSVATGSSWTTCGSYMIATLGIHPMSFLPFAFFNLLCPVVSLILATTGWTMEKREQNE